MYCVRCGHQLAEGAVYCSHCGAPLREKAPRDYTNSEKHYADEKGKTGRSTVLAVLLTIAVVIAGVEAFVLIRSGILNDEVTAQDSQEVERWGDTIDTAKQALSQEWREIFSDHIQDGMETDGYLEIKNTRVIEVKPNENELFSDVSAVVEFTLYSDYFGSTPYYSDARTADSVVFYNDGSCEVVRNPFLIYSANSFSYDYSDLIAAIYDFQSDFNEVYYLA